MDLVQFVIILIVVGFLLWMVNNYIPMDRKIKQILNAVVVIAVVLWIGNLFGLFSSLRGIHIGR
jgi:low temperature requirement protein LtrA